MKMKSILIMNGQVLDVMQQKIQRYDILLQDGIIQAINPQPDAIPQDTIRIDLQNQFIAPGLIESHLHIESCMMPPLTFCNHAVNHGTTTLLVDPHEIVNVTGLEGMKLWLAQSELVPVDMFVGIPSCVPATHMEHSGATIGVEEIEGLITEDRIYGLGEMMNFPGIIYDLGDARKKVDVAISHHKLVDGHAPGVSGDNLQKYITNGKLDQKIRIMSDHEATTVDEVKEKIEAGMYIALRYGSATRDMDNILPDLIKTNYPLDHIMFCSDDLSPSELFERGHIDRIILRAREIMLENSSMTLEEATLQALRMATHNPGQYILPFLKLTNRNPIGIIAPGYSANFIVFKDLEQMEITQVIYHGETIVENHTHKTAVSTFDYTPFLKSVHISKSFASNDFIIPYTGKNKSVNINIIQTTPVSLLTERVQMKWPVQMIDGIPQIRGDVAQDILKIAVLERHHDTGSAAFGLIQGLGIKNGAIASTVAHDNHNLIVVGTNDGDMAKLTNEMIARGGGMGTLIDGNITFFPLQIGGLMSSDPLDQIVKNYRAVKQAAQEMGSPLENVFMTLSFMALAVIPKLKITDMGLVDVDKFELIELFEENEVATQ